MEKKILEKHWKIKWRNKKKNEMEDLKEINVDRPNRNRWISIRNKYR